MLATVSRCYLIVDDSPLNLKWLDRILQSIGSCDIIQASDGIEAGDKLASAGERIDAIISDLRMPNMNGLELLKEVRLAKTGGRQSTPFFIVTSFTERALAGLALGLDVDAFLARPVKKQALDRHLSRICSGPRPAKSAAQAHATYADVDLTLAAMADTDLATDLPSLSAAEMSATAHRNGDVAVLDERMVALESVREDALLARDAVNSAGAVLLKAGERMTSSLRAVLMSYAEIDESLAKVWVKQ